LQNGLRLSRQPAELAGILTGVLLLVTIVLNRFSSATGRRSKNETSTEEIDVKNSQVAVLSAVILLAALIVAGSNWWLVGSLKRDSSKAQVGSSPEPGRRIQVAMMPKAKGDPYFVSCRQGAEEAAKELGVDLLWDGP